MFKHTFEERSEVLLMNVQPSRIVCPTYYIKWYTFRTSSEIYEVAEPQSHSEPSHLTFAAFSSRICRTILLSDCYALQDNGWETANNRRRRHSTKKWWSIAQEKERDWWKTSKMYFAKVDEARIKVTLWKTYSDQKGNCSHTEHKKDHMYTGGL